MEKNSDAFWEIHTSANNFITKNKENKKRKIATTNHQQKEHTYTHCIKEIRA